MSTFEIRYPDVEVPLIGQDGNAYAIMGRVSRALREAGVPEEAVSDYLFVCTQGDYDHLLLTTMRWVTVT